jgi:5-methylcytosine-specific restriction protein A
LVAASQRSARSLTMGLRPAAPPIIRQHVPEHLPVTRETGITQTIDRMKPDLPSLPAGMTKAALYGRQWQKARKAHLASEPLCRMCKKQGKIIAATVVDHIVPHRGHLQLFWDSANWQSLCSSHHNSAKQAEEKSGYIRGNDASGRPLDHNHPWNSRPRGGV